MTFAGSPDRAEARLVPEAGFELDTFQVSGLPRRPGPAQVRAVGKAMRAPKACKRILRAREPDVVLGGGGYVAGPMVYAASRLAIPAALMEADAHLGLANRLAAPFAERVFLAFPIEGRERPKYRVTGRPIPARNRATSRAEGRRVFDLPPRARVLLVFGGSQGAASLNDEIVEAFGEAGPAVLHLCGERDFERLRGRRPARRLQAGSVHERVRRGARRGGPRRRARGRLRLGGRRSREAGDPRPVPVRDRRPPGEERALLRARRRRDHGPGDGARPRRRSRALADRRPGAAEGDGRRDEAGREAGCGRGDRGRPDPACVLRAASSGSSGSAARASPATRCSRRRGGPRSRAGTATRRRTSSTSAPPGSRSRCRTRSSLAPDGYETVVSTAYMPRVPGTGTWPEEPGRVPRGARFAAGRDRRLGRAREDDDDRR